jgi:hypothetical protein
VDYIRLKTRLIGDVRLARFQRAMGMTRAAALGTIAMVHMAWAQTEDDVLSVDDIDHAGECLGIAQAMLGAGLAELVGDGLIRIRGAREELDNMMKGRTRGRKGADARWHGKSDTSGMHKHSLGNAHAYAERSAGTDERPVAADHGHGPPGPEPVADAPRHSKSTTSPMPKHSVSNAHAYAEKRREEKRREDSGDLAAKSAAPTEQAPLPGVVLSLQVQEEGEGHTVGYRARMAFAEEFESAHGVPPKWGGWEAKRLKRLLSEAGPAGTAEEIRTRSRRMFQRAPEWPCTTGGDFETLLTHWDKFATDPPEKQGRGVSARELGEITNQLRADQTRRQLGPAK